MHDPSGHGPDEVTAEADVVLADYMRRVDDGERVDRESFLAGHPEFSAEFREYFESVDESHRFDVARNGTTVLTIGFEPNPSKQRGPCRSRVSTRPRIAAKRSGWPEAPNRSAKDQGNAVAGIVTGTRANAGRRTVEPLSAIRFHVFPRWTDATRLPRTATRTTRFRGDRRNAGRTRGRFADERRQRDLLRRRPLPGHRNGANAMVQVWDTARDQLVKSIPITERAVLKLAFSSNGDLFGVGVPNYRSRTTARVYRWRIGTWDEASRTISLKTIRATYSSSVFDFAPDGSALVTAGVGERRRLTFADGHFAPFGPPYEGPRTGNWIAYAPDGHSFVN